MKKPTAISSRIPPSTPSNSPNRVFESLHRTIIPTSFKHCSPPTTRLKSRIHSKLKEEIHPKSIDLHTAASIGDLQTLQKLLSSKQVDPNISDLRGRTAMHFACVHGREDVVRLLLSSGADVASRDVNGNAPLHLAVLSNRIECVRVLLDNGAKVDDVDRFSKSPLDLVESRLRILTEFVKESANSRKSPAFAETRDDDMESGETCDADIDESDRGDSERVIIPIRMLEELKNVGLVSSRVNLANHTVD